METDWSHVRHHNLMQNLSLSLWLCQYGIGNGQSNDLIEISGEEEDFDYRSV